MKLQPKFSSCLDPNVWKLVGQTENEDIYYRNDDSQPQLFIEMQHGAKFMCPRFDDSEQYQKWFDLGAKRYRQSWLPSNTVRRSWCDTLYRHKLLILP